MKISVTGNLADYDVAMDLQWDTTSRIAVLGESGAGKTTLLRAIAGFETSLKVIGDFADQKPWQRPVCYLHQQPVMFPHLTVSQSYQFAHRHRHQQYDELPFDEWSQWLDIDTLLHKKSDQLSGGQAQRVALLRALYSQPALLLLDESFTALDTKRVNQACRVIDDYCQKTQSGFFMVSHQDKPVRMLAHNAVVIKNLKSSPMYSIFDALNHGQSAQLKTTVVAQCLEQEHNFLKSALADQSVYSSLPSSWAIGPARFTIDAHAISISLAKRAQTSLVNRLAVTIARHEPYGEEHYRLWLTIGDIGFWAVVSYWSFERLKLTDHQQVFAEFKVGALEWAGQFSV